MGTGIVSVALSLDGRESLSRLLFVLAAAGLIAVAIGLVGVAISDRVTLREHACVPGALTWVAAADVVGARLTLFGWRHEAEALLVVAVALWLVLVPCVLAHWRTPTVGLSFLLVVATESIAVLAARVGLVHEALVPLALGLAFYAFVVARFDLRQVLEGDGDHWVAGGALAIAALACARCGLQTLAIAVWAAAAAWLPVLLVAEILRPRLRFDARRWSTVFPMGMYAVCSFAAGGALTDFARAWVWIALAVWALAAAGTVRRLA
jgi:hypothetical protein